MLIAMEKMYFMIGIRMELHKKTSKFVINVLRCFFNNSILHYEVSVDMDLKISSSHIQK